MLEWQRRAVKVTLDVVCACRCQTCCSRKWQPPEILAQCSQRWLLYTERKSPVSSGPGKRSLMGEVSGGWLVWLVRKPTDAMTAQCNGDVKNTRNSNPGDAEDQLRSAGEEEDEGAGGRWWLRVTGCKMKWYLVWWWKQICSKSQQELSDSVQSAFPRWVAALNKWSCSGGKM